MDAIDTFLDAMFVPYPATPRLLEAKGELRAMMEDAYADAIGRGKTHNEAVGQVITDFGNLEPASPQSPRPPRRPGPHRSRRTTPPSATPLSPSRTRRPSPRPGAGPADCSAEASLCSSWPPSRCSPRSG